METYSQRPILHTRYQYSNHLFNSHHIEVILSKNQTMHNSKMIKTQKNSQRESFRLKNSFKLAQTPRTDVFEQAIEQVINYYKKIESQIEKYKNQEINKLLQLKQTASTAWKSYGSNSIKFIKSPQFKRKTNSGKDNYIFSPLPEGQKLISFACDFVKNIKQSIETKMKSFPIVGSEWIKLTGNNKSKIEDGARIFSDKVEVIRLKKKNLFMDVSHIEKSAKDTDEESFVSKKAFRQLFPEDQKTIANTQSF